MTATAPSRLRLVARRGRGPATGLAAQTLNSATNVATAYVASLLLPPEAFGVFVLGFAAVTLSIALGRGLVGTPMLTQLPVTAPADRPALIRSCLGFTLLVGGGATLVLLAVAPWSAAVLWFVPWVAAALAQDLGRHVFLAQRRLGAVLALDGAWAAAQVLVVALALIVGVPASLGLVATAWGIGAAAGLATFVVLLPTSARPAAPAAWSRAARAVAGWFTASAVLGQAEVYLVLLLVGLLLGPRDAGGLRAVQLLVFQPSMMLLGALLGLGTAAVARLGHDPDGPAIVAVWRRLTLAVVPVVVGVLLVAALAGPLMRLLFGQYLDDTALVLPIALQSAAAAVGMPLLAVLVGTRRGRTSLGLQLLRELLLVVGVGIGIAAAGPLGVAWGLAAATAAGVAVSGVVVVRIVRARTAAVPA